MPKSIRAAETTAQAIAVAEQAESAKAAGSPNAGTLQAASDRLSALARREQREAAAGQLPVLSPALSPADIKSQRRRSAVRFLDSVYLPTWDDIFLAMPTLFTRGTLFSATALDDEKQVQEKLVAESKGTKLYYSGVLLNQYAGRVYASCIDILKEQPLSRTGVERIGMLSFHELITRHLGLSYNVTTHGYVRRCLLHLSSASLRAVFRDGRNIQLPRLLTAHFYEPNYDAQKQLVLAGSDMLGIAVPEELAGLYCRNSFTRIHRQALSDKSELAAWLIWHYSGHSEPAWLSVEYLRELCGSTASERKFREMLGKALEELSSPTPEGYYVKHYAFTRQKKNEPAKVWVELAKYKVKANA